MGSQTQRIRRIVTKGYRLELCFRKERGGLRRHVVMSNSFSVSVELQVCCDEKGLLHSERCLTEVPSMFERQSL